MSEALSNGLWHHFFAIDQRIEAVCRLLMEETEDRCARGPLYFDSLAHALAVIVLDTVRDQQRRKTRAKAVPPGIRRAVHCLETDFADDLSVAELAERAQMSRSHFVASFRRFTGYAPHEYLLLVRLNNARTLIAHGGPALRFAEVAAACGFCDQAHLNRHFRRFFGTTLSAFRSRTLLEGCDRLKKLDKYSEGEPDILSGFERVR